MLPYTFQSEELLHMALTVPAPNLTVPDNQRLEFLGDAVLGLLVAEKLYAQHPDLDEGGLTEIRNGLVSGAAILERAERLGLSELLKAHNGGRSRWQTKELIDAVEALFGAAWLDGGRAAAEALFETFYTPTDCERRERPMADYRADNPKGDLLKLAQVRFKAVPTYAVVHQDGPSHAPFYHCSATLDGRSAEGTGTSIKRAEAEAARALLKQFEDESSLS